MVEKHAGDSSVPGGRGAGERTAARYRHALTVIESLLRTRQAGAWYRNVLPPLAEASGARRVLLFENRTGVMGSSPLRTHLRAEWRSPGVSSWLENPRFQNLDLGSLFPGYPPRAANGEPLLVTATEGGGDDATPAINGRPTLREPLETRTFLLLPILADGAIWGFLAFEHDAEAFAPWRAEEVTRLQTAADAVGRAEERHHADERIRWQATHDPLTWLPNRALLADTLPRFLEQALEKGEPLAVLFFDLDRFKRINDTLGHAVGDQLLRQFADQLRIALPSSSFLARMGGDEFVLLCPSMDRGEATYLSQRILELLRSATFLHQYGVSATVSIGVSVFPDDGASADILLRHADVALNQAKERGRNRIQFFAQEMYLQAMERLRLEQDLRDAIRRSEFRLEYQPQIELGTGKMVGVEALTRWQHPRRGRLLPGVFIPLVEELGSAVPLSDFVLRSACQQASEWERRATPIPIAINISPRQFRERNIIRTIADALAETGVSPDLIHLELTESALLDNAEATIRTLHSLRRLGVRIAVDDFGTGYSSLAYLRQFPLDFIKVDRLFVEQLANDTRDQAVVKAVIELAHGLEMKVIAEGVETRPQRDILANLGCDLIQGFYHSAAVPAATIEAQMDVADSHP